MAEYFISYVWWDKEGKQYFGRNAGFLVDYIDDSIIEDFEKDTAAFYGVETVIVLNIAPIGSKEPKQDLKGLWNSHSSLLNSQARMQDKISALETCNQTLEKHNQDMLKHFQQLQDRVHRLEQAGRAE